jgi:hypothetical protein
MIFESEITEVKQTKEEIEKMSKMNIFEAQIPLKLRIGGKGFIGSRRDLPISSH